MLSSPTSYASHDIVSIVTEALLHYGALSTYDCYISQEKTSKAVYLVLLPYIG